MTNSITEVTNSMSNTISEKKIEIVIFLLFLLLLIYISNKMNTKDKNCTSIVSSRSKYKKDYSTFYNIDELITNNYFKDKLNINNTKIDYEYKLKDFYIKTAYNCFCSGRFKNDYLDTCALKNAASYGARALDMQVFSLNGKPIVGSNSLNTNFYKESYNHITLNSALNNINEVYFSSENFGILKDDDMIDNNLQNDPLFLILRLHYGDNINKSLKNKSYQSKKIEFYDNIYNVLINNFDSSKFNSQALRNYYSNKDFNNNRVSIIPNISMKDTKGKIFLFVIINDETNTKNIKKSKLNNLVDLYGSTDEFKHFRYDEITEDGSYDISKHVSKSQLTYCMPTLDIYDDNYEFLNPMSYGIQFIGMNFQKQDSNMVMYNKFFVEQHGLQNTENNMTCPYIKKPDHMIELPLNINISA